MPAPDTAPQQEMHSLYQQHHGWLCSWLQRKLGCSHQASDVAQDTYLRILSSGRTPAHTQARPFLVQIAKGLLIDRYRRQQIEHAYLAALATLPPALSPSPEERLLALDALLRIDKALHHLPANVRHAFVMSQFDGLTYSDIALQLGVSTASVRKYMFKALDACWTAVNHG